jgi:hypothetical protein
MRQNLMAADIDKPEARAKDRFSARLRFGLVSAVPTNLAAHVAPQEI